MPGYGEEAGITGVEEMVKAGGTIFCGLMGGGEGE